MSQFKLFKIVNFEYQLKTYELITTSILKEIAHLESKQNINELTLDEAHTLEFYKHSLELLTETTFLQLYATLEEALYNECTHQLIKKNASLVRFEMPLNEQGYSTDNEHWQALVNLSKIRNCLLHGNGRLDSDRYGVDTKETINLINADSNSPVIELAHRKGNAKMKFSDKFLSYCCIKINNFICSQKV